MKPILIGGCGRSGTTMLASMLGSHSRVLTVPEFHFKTTVLRRLGTEMSRDTVPQALALLGEDLLFKSWELGATVEEASPDDFDGSYRQFVEYFVEQYGRQNGKVDVDHWVDHTPVNILHVSFLMRQFPDAKVVHLVRDGRAVAASVLPLDWGPHSPKRAAESWSIAVGAGLAAEAALPRERIMRVRFEDLVERPRAVLERLCGFVGVAFEPSMEEGAGFRVPRASTKQHALVGSAPDKRRIGAWEDILAPRKIEIFEFYAAGMLELLGYPARYGIHTRPPSRTEHFTMAAADAVLPYWRKLRYLKRHDVSRLPAIWKKVRGWKVR